MSTLPDANPSTLPSSAITPTRTPPPPVMASPITPCGAPLASTAPIQTPTGTPPAMPNPDAPSTLPSSGNVCGKCGKVFTFRTNRILTLKFAAVGLGCA